MACSNVEFGPFVVESLTPHRGSNLATWVDAIPGTDGEHLRGKTWKNLFWLNGCCGQMGLIDAHTRPKQKQTHIHWNDAITKSQKATGH